MATTKSLPVVTECEVNRALSESAREAGAAGALVPVVSESGLRRDPVLICGPVAQIPVQLDVAVPVREFRVRNLLALGLGQVIETRWANGEDVPLAAGQVQLAWSEFEVQENDLAVRITRLA